MCDFILNENEKQLLLKIARNAVKSLFDKGMKSRSETEIPDKLKAPLGAFVSLYNETQLRGCIGTFITSKALYATIKDLAISSATNDSRFEPVSASEVEDLTIEISVLTPLERIKSINEIELGVHGIYVKKGVFSGTFLPQVALKTSWTIEEFLGHCSRDKAGIGWYGWKDAELFRYRAIVFND